MVPLELSHLDLRYATLRIADPARRARLIFDPGGTRAFGLATAARTCPR